MASQKSNVTVIAKDEVETAKTVAAQRAERVAQEAARVALEQAKPPVQDNVTTVVIDKPGSPEADKPVDLPAKPEMSDGDRAMEKFNAMLNAVKTASGVSVVGKPSGGNKPSTSLRKLRLATGLSDAQLKQMADLWVSDTTPLEVITAGINATYGVDLHKTTVWTAFRALGYRKSEVAVPTTVTLIAVNPPATPKVDIIGGMASAAVTVS